MLYPLSYGEIEQDFDKFSSNEKQMKAIDHICPKPDLEDLGVVTHLGNFSY